MGVAMSSSTVCTGCSLLCDDVEVEVENEKVAHTLGACKRGMEHLVASHARWEQEMLDRAVQMLMASKSPLFYGLSNLSNEAIELALELAEKLGACVDFEASLCRGKGYELFLTSKNSADLDWVRNNAGVIVYLFCDPLSTHPRHLSMFSYYPRGENRQQGWEKDRKTFAIDAYECATTRVVNRFFYARHCEADQLFSSLASALAGKVPKPTEHLSQKQIIEVASSLKKAGSGVLVLGPELADINTDALEELLTALNGTNVRVLPTFTHANSRGLSRAIYERVGSVSPVVFDGKWKRCEGAASPESFDLLFNLGSDPVAAHPPLARIPSIISAASHPTLTGRLAQLNIPVAVLGVDEAGSALRLDGVKVDAPRLLDMGLESSTLLRQLVEQL